MKRKLSIVWTLGVLGALALAGLASAAAPPPADGPNLLANPGFEAPYIKQCCHTEGEYFPNTPIDEVQVAEGWSAWWLDPDIDAAHPGSCERIPAPCVPWHRPEWRDANCGAACADRYLAGNNAQKYFTFWSLHDAGMYQRVTGLRAGARLRFSIYMQAWTTNAGYGPSDYAQRMNMRVGIDPTGGLNPWSPNVVWSAPNDVYDHWGLYVVEATAQGGAVTVYTRTTPVYGIQHNDVYLDEASLVVVGGGGTVGSSGGGLPGPLDPAGRPTSAPAAPAGPPPRPTLAGNFVQVERSPTPAADGKVYYVVRSGDTLTHIAVRFNTSVARLKSLNGWRGNVIIYTGQRIIVGP